MDSRVKVAVIGATGSIGTQTLDIIRRHPERFTAVALSAHTGQDALIQAASVLDGSPLLCLSGRPSSNDRVRYSGQGALERLLEDSEADIVVNAAAGAAGLGVSLATVRMGKRLALANKETVVMAGRLVLSEASRVGCPVIPVDSEHSALFNLIQRFGRSSVRSVVITASGGAFRDLPAERLAGVTLKDALAHPTWSMGPKITVDSATMGNKGLEVIEASRLFDLQPGDIDVVIHPESRVHSLIRTREGSLYAQLSRPDMRIPILNALSWPDLADEDCADLDLASASITFRAIEPGRYPLLGLAYSALRAGEGHTDAYNAANEEAVAAFMDGRLPFTEISSVVDAVLSLDWPVVLDSIPAVLDTDTRAREAARGAIMERS